MVPDCWVELDRVYARRKRRFSPKAGRVRKRGQRAERDDPPDGSKKGPKGPSGMTHQTGPKKWRPPKNQKNLSRERGGEK